MITFKQFLTEALLNEAFSVDVFEGNISSSEIRKLGRSLAKAGVELSKLDFKPIDPKLFGITSRRNFLGSTTIKFTKLPRERKNHPGKTMIVVFVNTASKDVLVFGIYNQSEDDSGRVLLYKKTSDERLDGISRLSNVYDKTVKYEKVVDYLKEMFKQPNTRAYVAYTTFLKNDWSDGSRKNDDRRRNSIDPLIMRFMKDSDLYKQIKLALHKSGCKLTGMYIGGGLADKSFLRDMSEDNAEWRFLIKLKVTPLTNNDLVTKAHSPYRLFDDEEYSILISLPKDPDQAIGEWYHLGYVQLSYHQRNNKEANQHLQQCKEKLDSNLAKIKQKDLTKFVKQVDDFVKEQGFNIN